MNTQRSPREIWVGPVGQRIPDAPPAQVDVVDDDVIVTFAGERSLRFNPDWLRDNCPCDACRIRQTDERRWQPWLDATPAEIADARVTDGGVHVRWASGHESLYTATTFAAIDRASHRGGYTARLWSAGDEIDRFMHDHVVADVVTRRRMFESFRRDGAVVVTGAPTVPGSVITFLQSIGITLRDSSLGLIFDVKLDPAGYNIAFTSETVPPHNDNAQYAHPPSGQVLAMLVNDATGGDSIIVDGWAVVDQLERDDPTAVDVLTRVEVGHRQYSADVEAFARSPLIVRDRSGHFSHLRFSNQLQQPLPFDDPDLAEWYRAYRLLGASVTNPANQVMFRLEAGDMLIVNGYRVLHARTAYEPDGARHLQDVYFDTDDILGHLARMTGEATVDMVAPRH